MEWEVLEAFQKERQIRLVLLQSSQAALEVMTGEPWYETPCGCAIELLVEVWEQPA